MSWRERVRVASRRLRMWLTLAWRWADIGVQEALLLLALVLLPTGVGLCALGLGADGRLAMGAGAIVGGALLAVLAWPAGPRPVDSKRR